MYLPLRTQGTAAPSLRRPVPLSQYSTVQTCSAVRRALGHPQPVEPKLGYSHSPQLTLAHSSLSFGLALLSLPLSPSPPVLSLLPRPTLPHPACFPFNSSYYPSLPFPFCHSSASLLSSFPIPSSSTAFFLLELASSSSDLRPSSLINPVPFATQARGSRFVA